MATFPNLTDASLTPLRALKLQLDEDPGLLQSSECPYPPHIKAFLSQILLTGPVEPKDYDDDDLVRETVELYEDVKRESSKAMSDPKDKISMLKTSADLLTKLMNLRERAINVREMSRFQKTVIECLEAVITPAQRSEFIEKMSAYVR